MYPKEKEFAKLLMVLLTTLCLIGCITTKTKNLTFVGYVDSISTVGETTFISPSYCPYDDHRLELMDSFRADEYKEMKCSKCKRQFVVNDDGEIIE